MLGSVVAHSSRPLPGAGLDMSAHFALATDLAVTTCACLVVAVILRPELWRRLWFERIDPRPAALTRIGLGLIVLTTFANFLVPAPPLEDSMVRFLFTNDGLWFTDAARESYGGKLASLWDPELGFEHWYSAFVALGDGFTIFHIYNDPPFVFAMFALLMASALAMTLGYRTRYSTVLTWVLVESFYRHNPIFYTGGDTVVRVFLFFGMFMRWGEAYGIDCLRRRTRALALATVIPPLRRIAAWPQRILMLQLCFIYCATGLLKTGETWADGSALYYALNLDHFYRVPQAHVVGALQYVGVLPVATVLVRWWEVLFPLALLGAMLAAYERDRSQNRWPKAASWRRQLSYLAVGMAWVMLSYLAGLTAYYHLGAGLADDPQTRADLVSALVVATGVVAVAVYFSLRAWLPRVFRWGLTWLLGKRTWLGFGLVMHLGIDIGMNVGTFAEVMVVAYCVWLRGEDVEGFWRFVYSKPCAAGERERPRRSTWWRRVLGPHDRLRYRQPGPPVTVLHDGSDDGIRRLAILRLWDLGHRLQFRQHTASADALMVQVAAGPVVIGNNAGQALLRVLPGLLWLRPFARVPGCGRLALWVMRARVSRGPA